MDPHRPGLNGLRLRGCALRTFPAATPGYAARAGSAVVRTVVMVRNGADRSWRRCECFRRMAPPPISGGVGPRGYESFSSLPPGGGNCFLSGIGRAGNGDLSDFGSNFCWFVVRQCSTDQVCPRRWRRGESVWNRTYRRMRAAVLCLKFASTRPHLIAGVLTPAPAYAAVASSAARTELKKRKNCSTWVIFSAL
jgi:hypothetical protein